MRTPPIILVKILLIALLFVLLLPLLYGAYRTWKTGHSANYEQFISGSVPTEMPLGLYKGSAEELGEVSWKGKKFSDNGTGINVFESDGKSEEKYTFRIFPARSLRGDHEVLRIDYNQPGNPLWLRFIVDEMVSVGSDAYLGAVYITVVPGFAFRMGYFRLSLPH